MKDIDDVDSITKNEAIKWYFSLDDEHKTYICCIFLEFLDYLNKKIFH